ncbi:MAG: hypothetical protein ACRDA4_00270 [Filifactoraceae bacterium]
MEKLIPTIVSLAVSFILGIAGWIFKVVIFNKLEKHEEGIEKLKTDCSTKNDVKESMGSIVQDLEKIKSQYVTHDQLKELREDIKEIKDEYLKKDDFLNEMVKVDKKLDYITDIIVKWRN